MSGLDERPLKLVERCHTESTGELKRRFVRLIKNYEPVLLEALRRWLIVQPQFRYILEYKREQVADRFIRSAERCFVITITSERVSAGVNIDEWNR